MQDRVEMNIPLLTHIAADSEGQGRRGVQGYVFLNTIGYLKQYLEEYKGLELASLRQLVGSVKQLHERAKQLEQLCSLPQGEHTLMKMRAFCDNISKEIQRLQPNQELMLPGGWRNIDSPGHAMVYHFRRAADAKLRFYIYNAGAGINHHEKISTPDNERYYSTKIYEFPADISSEQLNLLIERLVTARLPKLREEKFDENKVYWESIEGVVPFIIDLKKTQPTLASQLFNETLTTTGQVSGTCTQRSLHQMLKHHFKTKEDYQRFIVDFKTDAIEKYFAAHTQNGKLYCSSKLYDLIQIMIVNTIKIADIDGLFTSIREKNQKLTRLYALQDQLTRVLDQPIPRPAGHEAQHYFDNKLTQRLFVRSRHRDEDLSFLQVNPKRQPITVSLSSQQPLVDQLSVLFQTCDAIKKADPFWVMSQIEKAILAVPLPNQFKEERPEYSSYFNNESRYDELSNVLKKIQILYESCWNVKLPSHLVIQMSFVALQDYLARHLADRMHRPHLEDAYAGKVSNYLKGYRHSPYFASHDAEFDARFVQLKTLYASEEREDSFNSMQYYTALLAHFPELFAELAHKYRGERLNISPDLRNRISKYKVEELYIFISQFNKNGQMKDSSFLKPEPGKTHSKWDCLVEIVQKSIEFERLISSGISHIFKDKSSESSWMSLNVVGEESLSLRTPLDLSYIRLDSQLTDNQYVFENSVARQVFLQDTLCDYIELVTRVFKQPSNTIQLSAHIGPNERAINKDDFFIRDLFHLRTSPVHQIDLTVGYFNSARHHLIDKNIQRYVEGNIFEPGLLRDIISQDRTFLPRFNAFIQSGKKAFLTANNQLSQEALFFVRLSAHVTRYIENTELLRSEIGQLDDLIVSNDDLNILSDLHRYRFLLLLKLYQTGAGKQHDFESALTSYFYIQARNNLYNQDDVATMHLLERAQREMQDWISDKNHTITPRMLRPILAQINPEFSHFELTQSETHWELKNLDNEQNYTIHVALGSIYFNNLKYSPLPLNLYQAPLMFSLGLGQETTCMISPNGRAMEFDKSEGKVRIIVQGDEFVVEKQFELNGVISWYQLQPISVQQKNKLRLSSSLLNTNNLPAILKDGSMQIWQACDSYRSEFILTRDAHPAYYYQNNQLQTWKNQPIDQVTQLIDFEDNNYILKIQDEAGETLNFERYGLKLIKIGQDYVHAEHTSWVYQPNKTFDLIPDAACMLFTDTQRDYFVVPIQPFYYNKQRETETGDFYAFKHDVSNHIGLAKLKKHEENNNVEEVNKLLWYHQNTSQTVTYPMVDGKPRPDKAADGLYLCYLYLAQGQTILAWDTLTDIQRRLPLEGSYEELTYLEWIMNGLPVVLEDEDEEAVRDLPQYTACQMKALSLLTTLLLRDKKPQFPNLDAIDKTTANGQYEVIKRDEVTNFYEGLPSQIYNKLNDYFTRERYLIHPFHLDATARNSLLDYYTSKQPQDKKNLLGALGYNQLISNLSALSAEIKFIEKNLQEIEAHPESSSFSPLDLKSSQDRLEAIKVEVALQKDVMKRSTEIELMAIDLSWSEKNKFEIRESSLSRYALQFYGNWKYNLLNYKSILPGYETMRALTPNISQDDFFKYFPEYFLIAKTTCDSNHLKLRDFCEKYLIAHRHVPFSKQPTNIPLLVNLLYRTCCLKNKKKISYCSSLGTVANELTKANDFTPIEIYQPLDVFKELLSNSEEIFERILSQSPTLSPAIPLPDVIEFTPLHEALKTRESDGFNAFCEQYEGHESQYDGELKEILASFSSNLSPTQLNEAEAAAGKLQYELLIANRGVAEQLSPELLQPLASKLKNLQNTWQGDVDKQWADIVRLAQKTPSDPKEAQRVLIAKRALKQPELSENDLFNLYFNGQELAYQERTGLSTEEIHALHGMIHVYAQQKLYLQHILRVEKTLQDTLQDPSPTQRQLLASTLMSKNLLKARQDPSILRFQLEENKLLREQQVDAIQLLLSTPDDNRHQFTDAIIKIIMGGGKSKVVLPLAAKKKATGLNLVVIEVPRALLATNYSDLNATSQKIFDQKAHLFEFDRESDASSARLNMIYHQLLKTMTNRDYLVTTGESVQSFALKYYELLYSRPTEASEPDEIAEWDAQVQIASKIVRLFKERGDVIIDEVHQGLLLKKKLNYAFGEPTPVSSKVIRLNVSLYQFAQGLMPTYSDVDFGNVKDEQENIKRREKWVTKHWNEIKADFPHQLIHHQDSPLHDYVTQLCGDDRGKKRELVLYLQNKKTCDFLLDCGNKDILDAFAFFKVQQKIASMTLTKQYEESYGSSKKEDVPELKKMLAIPYLGNGKANESSRFSSQLETINLTIQSMMITGITRTMLEEIVQQWLAQARDEIMTTKKKRYGETKIAEGVNAVYLRQLGISFEDLDVRNQELMDRLHQALQYNQGFIFDVLENQILPQIHQEKYVLSSNALNHADQYRSRQGTSGTLKNYITMLQSMNFNPKTSLGSDEYIQQILKHKNTPVHHIPFTNLNAFLDKALNGPDAHQIHAIMDISATFSGYSNIAVAQALAHFYQDNPNMKYILYFDKLDRLCALSCQNAAQEPIVLNTSDPAEITAKLNGCGPAGRFTYYDQLHTVGTDIKQASRVPLASDITSTVGAKGLALIDERTQLQDYLQGAMRMRELDAGHSLSIISQNNLTLEEHHQNMANNENRQLKEDSFVAAIEKLTNLIRDDLSKRITSERSSARQADLAEAFKQYFIEVQELDLFKQYGSVSKLIDTKVVLDDYAQTMIHEWLKLLESVKIVPEKKQKSYISRIADEIITQALPHCNKQVMWYGKEREGQENEKEKQREVQKEIENQKQEEFFNPTLTVVDQAPWGASEVLNFSHDELISSGLFASAVKTISVTSLVKELPPGSQVSDNIKITSNYRLTYKGQERMLGYYLKPVQAVLFRKGKRTGKLTATLITNEELAQISPHIKAHNNLWISDVSQTVLCGVRPPDVLEDKAYLELMEQVLYFGGEMRALANQESALTWMSESLEEKLQFFNDHIMPYRKTLPDDLTTMKAVLSNAYAGYEYISHHAFEDLRSCEWENQFPKLTRQALASLNTLASIYADINQNSPRPITDNIEQTYLNRYPLLPPAAIAYVFKHMNTHRIIEIIEILNSLNAAKHVNDLPAKLMKLFKLDFAKISKDCEYNVYLIQFHILMACFSSSAFNDPLSHMPCIRTNPLITALGLHAPLTSEHLMLGILRHPNMLKTSNDLKQLLCYPQTSETLAALFSHRLIRQALITDSEFYSILQNCSFADIELILNTIDGLITSDVVKMNFIGQLLHHFKVEDLSVISPYMERIKALPAELMTIEFYKKLNAIDIKSDQWGMLMVDVALKLGRDYLDELLKNQNLKLGYWKILIEQVSPDILPVIFEKPGIVLPVECLPRIVERASGAEFLKKIALSKRCDSILAKKILAHPLCTDEIRVKLGSVDNSFSDALRPVTCSREPEILLNARRYCTELDRAGSREQVAGRRDLSCKQPLDQTSQTDSPKPIPVVTRKALQDDIQNDAVKNQAIRVVQEFIDHLNRLKNKKLNLDSFLDDLIRLSESFKKEPMNTINLGRYKSNCRKTLNSHKENLSHALTRNLTFFEYISEVFRLFFNVLDKLFSGLLGKKPKADNPNRISIFSKPDRRSALGKAMQEFEEKLAGLDSNIQI